MSSTESKTILYNPIAGDAEAREKIDALHASLPGSQLVDICEIKDYTAFFEVVGSSADIIICGGDGTLNYFANATADVDYSNDIYYYPTGTGNDFARDIGYDRFATPDFKINDYIKNLPLVTVNGKTQHFLNNVGFGIDGYCCVVGDALREENKKNGTNKPINYTMIAIKGLLFHFKSRNARVVVDGKEYTFKKVWIAPTMNGRYYGGGMMAAPEQKRLADNTVSLMVYHSAGNLKALMAFPSIFKGEHVKKTKMVTVLTGHSIDVEFDEPTPLQIDGETIYDVLSYSVSSAELSKKSAEAAAASL